MLDKDEIGDALPSPARVIFVTGPSGAGRTTAIHVLEDNGFETIDNVPLGLVPRLLKDASSEQPIALSIGARTRDFSTNAVVELIDTISKNSNVMLEVLYVDAHPDVLIQRFSETRRRHPLAPAEYPAKGIKREFDLLGAIRDRADHLLDTSEMSIHDMRADIERRFLADHRKNLSITAHSFSYKRGLPRGIDMVFDCRFLTNPYWDKALRDMDGRDHKVVEFIEKDALFEPFLTSVFNLTQMLLPAYKTEGKAHLSLAFGCTGGQHRSVVVAERLCRLLGDQGWLVTVRHRELERFALIGSPHNSLPDPEETP